jgi:hypothetical protein
MVSAYVTFSLDDSGAFSMNCICMQLFIRAYKCCSQVSVEFSKGLLLCNSLRFTIVSVTVHLFSAEHHDTMYKGHSAVFWRHAVSSSSLPAQCMLQMFSNKHVLTR